MRVEMEHLRLEREREERARTSSESSSSIAIKVPKPRTYHGAHNFLVIDTWIHRMEDYLEMTKTKDDMKAHIAAGYLEGPVFT